MHELNHSALGLKVCDRPECLDYYKISDLRKGFKGLIVSCTLDSKSTGDGGQGWYAALVQANLEDYYQSVLWIINLNPGD